MKRMIALALAVCLWDATITLGAGPGVPDLPDTQYDYVAYAETNLPAHFQTPAVQNLDNTPANNPLTNAGAELGRVLFYDKRLSQNHGTACASCHQQENGFSDPDPLSTGFEGGLTGRNSMGLSNARYYAPGNFFWDHRADTLEDQVLGPIQDPVEMGLTLEQMVSRVESADYYASLFENAFGDSEVTSERVSRALSQFVRSMVSYQSKFDEAFDENGNEDFAAIFTAQELAGRDLFHGEGRCDNCHRGNLQTANTTHNIGLDIDNSADEGAGNGEFKVPSLRNIAERGTYMHDGRFSSLEEVVQHYSTGVQNNPDLDRGLRTNNGQVRRLNWNTTEIAAVVAYMETFSDQAFLTSELFSDPFVDLPGDYNADGIVDAEDYTAWRSAFGSPDSLADGNGDGIVNSADYTVWRDNIGASWVDFNSGASLSNSPAAVPEPSSIALAVGVSTGALWTMRRRQRQRPG